MRHNFKRWILGVVVIAGCAGMMGCSFTKDNSKSGDLNSDAGKRHNNLDYDGSVVDENTLEKLASLETIIDKSYYFDTSDEDMQNGLYAGLIEALDDPYAKYYTPEEYAKLQEDSSGEYAGIGVVVRQDEETGYAIAVSITEDSPASEVDIKPDDLICKIDDYEIQESDDLDYLVTKIRGEEGTDVTLEIYRPSERKYHTVTITRRKLENSTVSYFMADADKKIGYVRVTQFVANTNDPVVTKRFYSIPVKVMNEDALTKRGYAYEILDGEEVNITVKGKSSIVRSMGISDFQAIADFSKLSKVDAVPIDVTAKKYSDQLDITLGTTNTMKIKKDEVVTISVPVNVTAKGDPAEGYAVGRVTSTPNLIKVSGPENLLSSAKEIRATVSVDGISHDVTATDKPVLYDEEGKKIISNQIEFDTASIGIYIELWKTKTVDVKLSYTGEPAKNYHLVSFDYEPKQITIAAPDDMLESLDSITLDSVSIEGLMEDYEKDIDLTQTVLPDNVILANDDTSDVKVKATIEKITSHKLSFTKKDINIMNNTNNYKVSFDKDNDYSILVDGAASAVKNLDIKDFVPWIDINGLEPGTHEVSLHVKDVEGVTVGATTKLKITLKENN